MVGGKNGQWGKNGRLGAENGRLGAENGRLGAENGRLGAETSGWVLKRV